MTDERPPTFLIVDDDQETIKLLEALVRFEFPESKIKSISKSRDAMQTVESMKPDVVLLDIMMEEINGIAISKLLKSNPDTHKIVVIIVSALSDDGTRKDALNTGADEFITKPVHPKIFSQQVKDTIQKWRLGIYTEDS